MEIIHNFYVCFFHSPFTIYPVRDLFLLTPSGGFIIRASTFRQSKFMLSNKHRLNLADPPTAAIVFYYSSYGFCRQMLNPCPLSFLILGDADQSFWVVTLKPISLDLKKYQHSFFSKVEFAMLLSPNNFSQKSPS